MTGKKELLYILLQTIPPGYVTTYSSLAKILKTSPRAVARMLKYNSNPVVVPCHRVVSASGDLGGYTLGGKPSRELKRRLLELEGVEVFGGKVSKRCIIHLDDLLLG